MVVGTTAGLPVTTATVVGDGEEVDLQIFANFQTNFAAVPHEVNGDPDQGYVEEEDLGEDSVEVLVQYQEEGGQHGGVPVSDLSLAHVSNHESVGDLGPNEAKQQNIQYGVVMVNVLKHYK